MRRLIGSILGVAFSIVTVRAANATPYESGGKVDEYFGSYTEQIPIVVPPFHGIEPKLAIGYNSGRRDGYLGVGWALHGLSVIEPVDGSFVISGTKYTLDGQLLISCYSQTDKVGSVYRSPACASGSLLTSTTKFSTESETYARIELGPDPETSVMTFFVTQRNGTTMTYRKAGQKFLLARVADTDGNTVEYEWNGAAQGFSFNAPSAVKYNNNTIKFYYAPTVGVPITYAENGSMTTLDRQLVTVDVCLGAAPCARNGFQDPNRMRAYKLAYRPSASTSRALLTSVQMFGKDARITDSTPASATAGTVTGGSSLPAMTFGWSDVAPAYVERVIGEVQDWGVDWSRGMVDFNGDGRTDYCRASGGSLVCALSSGLGKTDITVGSVADLGGDHDGAWVDWDGNGKSDFCRLVCEDNGGGSCEVWEQPHYKLRCAFSNGSTVNDLVIGEIAPAQRGGPGGRWFADTNGDGKTDFCRVFDDPNDVSIHHNKMKCAVSTGTGFTDVTFGTLENSSASFEDIVGQFGTRAMTDWNGDGRMDFCRVVTVAGGNRIHCIMGQSDIFDRTKVIDSPSQNPDRDIGPITEAGLPGGQFWVDANGDGKSDFCRVTNTTGTVMCAFSKGSSDFQDATWTTLAGGYTDTRRWGDLNRDGKLDLCVDDGTKHVCIESTGKTSLIRGGTGSTTRGYFEKHWMVDWNGDGRDEYCFNAFTDHGPGSNLMCLMREPTMSDLATSFTNGYGSTTTVSYGLSTTGGQNHPIFPIVASVTRTGGQEGPVTQSYAYAGGEYDAFARRFLGFAKVTVTHPMLAYETVATRTSTETTYRLHWRYPTKPATITRLRGTEPVERIAYRYVDNDKSPYRSDVIDETTTKFELYNFVTSDRRWDYDTLGNATTITDLGLIDGAYGAPTSDDREIRTTYVPNLMKYIIDKPSQIASFDISNGAANAVKLTEVNYRYDVAEAHEPDRGHATKIDSWLDSNNTLITKRAVYDSNGNVTSETDGAGNTTTYGIVDTQYIGWVVRPTTPGTTLTTTYVTDLKCSATRLETVATNPGTLTTFDQLCRKERIDYPAGGYEVFAYNDVLFGTASQLTEVRKPGPSGLSSGDLWERTYFDGLGRTTKIVKRGAATTGDIIDVEYEYDLRGHIAEKTRPRFVNGVIYAYTYRYDALDRETTAALPPAIMDGRYEPGETTTTTYWGNSKTTFDGGGHAVYTSFDAHGRRALVCTSVSGSCQADITYYTYDARGNASSIAQLAGGQWVTTTFTTDSLGRKTATNDPDAGARSYAYDGGGNLVDEVDANGARTRYTYDGMRRRRTKTINYCAHKCFGPPAVTVTWIFDERRGGYANAGRLTSMIDPSGTATYDYDDAGNLVHGGRTVDGTSHMFLKRFDTGNRLLGTTFPDGSALGAPGDTLDYDSAGRLAYIPNVVMQAGYDAAGNLTSYLAANGSTSTFKTDTPRGLVRSYATTGMTTYGPTAILGDFATGSAPRFSINPNLTAGQTITVSTCPSIIASAAGTGATALSLVKITGASEQVVASATAAGGTCGSLSTIAFTVPAGGDGTYAVRPSCATGACTGTVAARLVNPGTNLALGKWVGMSTEFDPGCGPSSSAVDGVTTGEWCTANSMAHSQYEKAPWLFVDLGSIQSLDHVNVWNRSDSLCDKPCLFRLANFDILVYDWNAGWVQVAHVDGRALYPTTIDLGGIQARHVMIRLRDTNYLNLPELEVIGSGTPATLIGDASVHQVQLSRNQDGRIVQVTSNRPRESWTYQYDGFHQLTRTQNSQDSSLTETYAYDGGNMIYGPAGAATYGAATDHPHALRTAAGITYTYDANGQQTGSSTGGTIGWDGAGRLADIAGVHYTTTPMAIA